MAASKSFEVTFTKDRETKGTFRYAEDESPERPELFIGSLYVRKFALANLDMPEKITVAVKAGA
jgi:hypothetical protein